MLYSSLKEAYFPKENFGKSKAECKAAHCPDPQQCGTNAAYQACRTQESFNVDWAGVGTALGITPKEEDVAAAAGAATSGTTTEFSNVYDDEDEEEYMSLFDKDTKKAMKEPFNSVKKRRRSRNKNKIELFSALSSSDVQYLTLIVNGGIFLLLLIMLICKSNL